MFDCLVEICGKQLGHFKHGDLIFSEDGFALGVCVNIAFIRSVLKAVCLDVFPYFFVTSVCGIASLPMTAASSADGVSGLLKLVGAPAVFATGAFFDTGDFFVAVAINSPNE